MGSDIPKDAPHLNNQAKGKNSYDAIVVGSGISGGWEAAVAEVKETAKKEAKAETESTKKAVKNIQAKVEKTTLGDLSALAEIKAKLQEGEGDKQ